MRVVSNDTFGEAKGWIVPFTEEFQFTASQELKTPIKDFISDLQSLAADTSISMGLSALKPLLDTAQKMSNLFGVQLNNRSYYASSWGGSKPSTFSVTLSFFLGSQNTWNAKTEVYTPIMEVMARTVPSENGVVLTAPMPTGLSVFLAYGAELLIGTLGFADTAMKTGIEAASKGIVGGAEKIAGKNADDAKVWAQKIMSKVWTVDLGWLNSSGDFHSFFTLSNNIVSSSTLKFSPKVQNIGGKPYPISGTVTLEMQTQSIATNQSFKTS